MGGAVLEGKKGVGGGKRGRGNVQQWPNQETSSNHNESNTMQDLFVPTVA